MIKKITLASLALMMSTSAVMAEEHSESGELYIVAKALYAIGNKVDEVKEGDSLTLDGKAGGGMGLDLGYTLPYHFAVELDTSYSENKVTVKNHTTDETEKFTAKTWTYALDLVYAYPVNHSFNIMGKVGYEFEREKMGTETVKDNGMVYGAGVEYHIDEHYEALLEYEGSMIDSPRGDSVFAGIKYIF